MHTGIHKIRQERLTANNKGHDKESQKQLHRTSNESVHGIGGETALPPRDLKR